MSGCDEPCGCTAAALTYGSKNEFGRRQRSSPKSLRSTWARSILVCIISYRSTKNSSSIGRRRTSKPRATWSFAIASRRCARHRLRPQRGSPQPSVRAVLHDEAPNTQGWGCQSAARLSRRTPGNCGPRQTSRRRCISVHFTSRSNGLVCRSETVRGSR